MLSKRKSHNIKNRSNFILIAQNDKQARQWQFSERTALSVVALAVVLVATALFFSADLLTKFIYKTKLAEMRTQYAAMADKLSDLQTHLQELDLNVNDIEARDEAIRTYADLPSIDSDVRQLGIGGLHLSKPNHRNGPAPDLETALDDIEVDIDRLTREVRLELTSYNTIYDKVVEDAARIASLPSIRPVISGYLTSNFGYRFDPIDGEYRFHYGQDIAARRGTPVYATADGEVIQVRRWGGLGKTIKIKHDYGYATVYGHLSEYNVEKGHKVKRGEMIGKVGNTGRSTAPHLHYEVHYYNTAQNPRDYFFSSIDE